jgi:predicted transcriptional regulator
MMVVHFSEELQAKLADIAAQQGRNADELVQDVLARYVEDEARFLEAVEKGIRAAESGDFVEEAEMDARIEQMLKS